MQEPSNGSGDERPGLFDRVFDVFFTGWAAVGLPLLVAVAGFILHASIP